jgi:hypothetical protein
VAEVAEQAGVKEEAKESEGGEQVALMEQGPGEAGATTAAFPADENDLENGEEMAGCTIFESDVQKEPATKEEAAT